MKIWKIILVLAIIGAIIGAAVAYYVYNKPHRDIAGEEAAYSVTANELYTAYEAEESAANEKYLDQVIEVRGTVEDISTNDVGQPTIILSAEDAMLGGVSATMKATEELSVQAGDEVVLKCRCTGMLMDVVLVDCSFVE